MNVLNGLTRAELISRESFRVLELMLDISGLLLLDDSVFLFAYVKMSIP
jgi:hypothetical protein